MQMAETVGQHNFALQQKAISSRIDQRPYLSSYTSPSCVVCGDIDELTPPELSVEMAELLPNCDLKLLGGNWASVNHGSARRLSCCDAEPDRRAAGR